MRIRPPNVVARGAEPAHRVVLAWAAGLAGLGAGVVAGFALAERLLVRRVAVTNASMYPLLRPGDRVVFDRIAYRLRPPRRGEVVLVRRPGEEPPLWIKIVAGLPGEMVRLDGERLWLDGRAATLWQPLVGGPTREWRLGGDEYFVLSYALAVGADSRQVGPVWRRALVGPARRIYWPVERRTRLEPLEISTTPAAP